MAKFSNQATLKFNGNITTSNIVEGNLLETLNITKTAVVETYHAKDDVSYIINIRNSGTGELPNLQMEDDLGGYPYKEGTAEETTLYPLNYVENSLKYEINGNLSENPTVDSTGNTLKVSGITVPANGNVSIIYKAEVTEFAPLAPDSTIKNTASFTGGTLLDPVTATETVTAENVSDLSITKSITPSEVTGNGPITYTFVIQNAGNTATTATDALSVGDTFDPIITITSVTLDGANFPAANYDYDPATGVFATKSYSPDVEGSVSTVTVPKATYEIDDATGAVIINPGVAVLTIKGTLN